MPFLLYGRTLFEWTEIQGDSRVLQIGSDYGSYTGLLARRAGETVVLDPRDENLEVTVCAMERMEISVLSGGIS